MRLFSVLNTRILLAAAALCALALGLSVQTQAPHTVDATHQGVVQPATGAILQGHRMSLPVQMVTCTTITATANNACRLGAYQVKMQFDAARFSLLTEGGVSTGGNTATTLVDTSRSWTPNMWAGSTVTLRSGPGAVGASGGLQVRFVLSNTATTLTINPSWDGNVPLPALNTSYVVGGTGISTGSNTSTTLLDTQKLWKVNQWVGARVTLLGGSGYTGSNGNPQSRIIVSNTATALTVSPAWDGGVIPLPNATTRYVVGGMTNGGFLGSTGRNVLCTNEPVYALGMVELACITLGNGPPFGANGTGVLTNLTVQAGSSAVGATPCGSPGAWVPCFPRGIAAITLATPDTQTLRIDGFDILADIVNTNRRIMLCPDANPTPDNLVSAIDMSLIAQQFLKQVGQAGYTTTRDPDENGTITATDLSLTAQVFGKRCTQV